MINIIETIEIMNYYTIPYLVISFIFGILDLFKPIRLYIYNKRLGSHKYPTFDKYKKASIPVFTNLIINNIIGYFVLRNVNFISFNSKIYYLDTYYIFNIIFCLLFCILMTDIWFYTTHRLFHKIPFLYKNIHSQHHYYVEPFAFSGIECHFIEHIFINICSTSIGMYLLAINNILSIEFIKLWFLLVAISTTFTHSGYIFFNDVHFNHHLYLKYNYGISPYFCDNLFNTKYK